MDDAAFGRIRLQHVDVGLRMRAQQLLHVGQRRIVIGEVEIEAGSDQPVLDGA